MENEKYLFIQDQKQKKSITRSARHARTHCGKGGRVKLPSDYLSKKELKAMSGECKTYRLNSPMKWDEFREMPDDLKVTYINILRGKWNPPDTYIGQMLGVPQKRISDEVARLGLSLGKTRSGRTHWNKEGFLAWVNGVTNTDNPGEETQVFPEVPEEVEQAVESTFIEDVEQVVEYLDEPVSCEPDPVPEAKVLPVNKVIPTCGSMTLVGRTEDVLNTLSVLLGGAEITINIAWETHTEGV